METNKDRKISRGEKVAAKSSRDHQSPMTIARGVRRLEKRGIRAVSAAASATGRRVICTNNGVTGANGAPASRISAREDSGSGCKHCTIRPASSGIKTKLRISIRPNGAVARAARSSAKESARPTENTRRNSDRKASRGISVSEIIGRVLRGRRSDISPPGSVAKSSSWRRTRCC